MRRRHLATLPLVAILGRAGIARAAWPDQPIQVFCPGPPGGGMDVLARTILPFVAPRLGNATMVVINRPTAAGQLAFEGVALAAPDGYSIGVAQTPNMLTLPIERQVRYRADQFVYIANVVEDPGGLFVRADAPEKTLADLIARAKREPGSVTIGSAGIGSDDHLLILQLQEATGVSFAHVPYNGTPPIVAGLLAGDIVAGSFNLSEGLGLFQQKSIHLVGQASATRWAPMADVPTFREQGIDMVAGSVRGVIAPPGLPDELRDRFRKAFADALADPAFIAEAKRLNMPLRPMTGDEQHAFFMEDDAKLRALWKRRPWRE